MVFKKPEIFSEIVLEIYKKFKKKLKKLKSFWKFHHDLLRNFINFNRFPVINPFISFKRFLLKMPSPPPKFQSSIT